MSKLSEVFKKSGVPTHTFVEPNEYTRVIVALQTPGRGIIVEGPSGIGKTSCIKKALENLGMDSSCLILSARKLSDQGLVNDLNTMRKIGVVVIDDFHVLPEEMKKKLTDYIKVLADEEDVDSKVILIGINRAGQSLVDYAPDLLHRVEIIRVGKANDEKIRELVNLGARALNCSIATAEEIVDESEGSFAIAQVLCHEACLQGGVLETALGLRKNIETSLPSIRENVFRELSPRFLPVARDFATGNKLRREGRAPYLHLLLWLSKTSEGVLDTKDALAANPKLKGSVSQVIEKEHLTGLIGKNSAIGDMIHFDSKSELLSVEDPKLLYFLRHIIWSKFARQIGYYNIDFDSKYDFALSFAGENRDLAEAIFKELQEREISVFYDKNEQHRILGNDVEEYLAPIYRSESRFVVVLLSSHYPKKIWTKFESDQFKERFGQNSVIPIWFKDCPVGLFDETRNVGGLTFDPSLDFEQEFLHIVEVLAHKLEEERITEKKQAQVE